MDSLTRTSTKVPGLRNKVMVDMDQLAALSDALRSSIPADIQEAREILRQKESMVNQAHLEARRIKEGARQEQTARLDDTEIKRQSELKADKVHQDALQKAQEITQDAQRRAYKIVEDAEELSNTRLEGANQYARETLFELEERLSTVLGQVRRGIDTLGIQVETKVPS